MDFTRVWTDLVLEAEIDCFGVSRLRKAHNDEVAMLRKTVKELYERIDGMNEKRIFRVAAEAYRQGKSQDDNPFDEDKQPEQHELWRLAFGEESAYWEYQYGINVHGR